MYYTIKDNVMYQAKDSNALKDYLTEIKVLPSDYEAGKYIVVDNKLVINENYEQEQAQKEKERIAKLTCTKRVFALMLQELGIDYLTMLKPLIESNAQAQLEWDLCVELERGNPLLDIMAGQLGVTPEQLDGLFKHANGEITIEEFRNLIPVEVENEIATNTTNEPTDIPVQPQDEDGLQEGAITD